MIRFCSAPGPMKGFWSDEPAAVRLVAAYALAQAFQAHVHRLKDQHFLAEMGSPTGAWRYPSRRAVAWISALMTFEEETMVYHFVRAARQFAPHFVDDLVAEAYRSATDRSAAEYDEELAQLRGAWAAWSAAYSKTPSQAATAPNVTARAGRW